MCVRQHLTPPSHQRLYAISAACTALDVTNPLAPAQRQLSALQLGGQFAVRPRLRACTFQDQ